MMKFTAVGDLAILRRIQPDFEGFSELAPFICQGDARFFNLETTLHEEGECPSAQLSGGTYLQEICAPFGTEIMMEDDGILTCRWEAKGEETCVLN